MYRIWCVVDGGVTGHRETWLKANTEVAEFPDRASAEAEAERLNHAMNAHPFKAAFHYSVVEV